ncbi:hypothetical protein MP228_004939 [Amoeboaphelidium protococcarum]|nr:hypothetical protein MP228_004939 [Amoeboaphelidium protococcarum]
MSESREQVKQLFLSASSDIQLFEALKKGYDLIKDDAELAQIIADSDNLRLAAMSFSLDSSFGCKVFALLPIGYLIDCLEYESADRQVTILQYLQVAASHAKCNKVLQSSKDFNDYLATFASGGGKSLVVGQSRSSNSSSKVNDPAQVEQLRNLVQILKVKLQKERNLEAFKEQFDNNTSVAVEGIAYLIVSWKNRRLLGGDEEFLKKFIAYGQSNDITQIQYGLAAIVYNLCSYKRKLSEEQEQVMKLRKFAKDEDAVSQMGPGGEGSNDDDVADANEVIDQRCRHLIDLGVMSLLHKIVKSGCSSQCMKLLAVILNQLSNIIDRRAVLAQQGIVKVGMILLNDDPLPKEIKFIPVQNDQDSLQLNVCSAFSKIAITVDPNYAFTRDRVIELIRPLLYLTQSTYELHQFEAMMALTNLMSIEKDREVVLEFACKAGIMKGIENVVFSDNVLVRRSAVECCCNMLYCEPAIKFFSGNRDKVKLMLALCTVDDEATVSAASGALAIMSICGEDVVPWAAESKTICSYIADLVPLSQNAIDELLSSQSVALLQRACMITRNLISAGRKQLLEGNVKQLQKQLTSGDPEIRKTAQFTLQQISLQKED